MTEKTEKVVFENPDGEIYDVYGAFDRHPALTGRNADTDISVELNPSYELEFTIRVGAGTMAHLVQILNSAPVDGNPLNVTVNLWGDTTVTEVEREDILNFLSDNGYDATLENIAAGYLYEVKNPKPLLIDVVTDERREYVVARVLSKVTKTTVDTGTGYSGLSYVTLRVPGECVVLETFKNELDISDFKGETVGSGDYRIIHVAEPGGHAPLGGFILERIKGGTN
nr:MAG TPA: hypothetical protein [Caudoviricetes sp.]